MCAVLLFKGVVSIHPHFSESSPFMPSQNVDMIGGRYCFICYDAVYFTFLFV